MTSTIPCPNCGHAILMSSGDPLTFIPAPPNATIVNPSVYFKANAAAPSLIPPIRISTNAAAAEPMRYPYGVSAFE